MEFQFGEKEERLRTEIREFVKAEMPPHYIGKYFEEETNDEDWAFSMAMSKKLAQKGWLTMSWPKEYGGMDASRWERVVFAEEASYWGIPGLGMGISGTAWVGPSLMLFGTEEQKKKYIPQIATGEPDGVWCTGYSEPDAGSDMAAMQTSAIRDGDAYVINGQKVWTSCAHYARWLWLACRTDPEAKKKHQGLSLIIVDMKSPGLTVRPLENYVGGHVFNELFFKDVRVPVKNLVGVEGKGWSQLMTALSFERGTAIGTTASAQRLLDELVIYTKGTGQIKQPEIRQKLARLAIDIEAARVMAHEVVWMETVGKPVLHEPSRDKAFGDMLQEKLGRIGSDIIGVFSQMDPAAYKNRWSRLRGAFEHLYHYNIGFAIAAGTTDTQRNIMGQFGLQLPRAY
ncbi:acyl-CoA dehydrogenase family protein [bacterium]|nr:acyl-CoA dehydrogenase family protein [bacterium]